MSLLLGSCSPTRRALLARLGIPFDVVAPAFDEDTTRSLPPAMRALANARGKAEAVARAHPTASVIGSDQVAVCNGIVLGKPGEIPRAIAQLRAMRGQTTVFFTAVVLRAPDGGMREHIEETIVRVRADLSDAEIEAYVHAERPLGSAGAFLAEGLGIALLESVIARDPTALLGLPLITLADWLRPLQRLSRRSQTSNDNGHGVSGPGA